MLKWDIINTAFSLWKFIFLKFNIRIYCVRCKHVDVLLAD